MEGGPNKKWYDFVLEKIAPITAFALIAAPILLVLVDTQASIIFLIIIHTYFFYKSAAMAIQFVLGLNRMQNARQIDWQGLLDGLENIDGNIDRLSELKKKLKSLNADEFLNHDENFLKYEINQSFLEKFESYPKLFRKLLINLEKRKALKFLDEELNSLKEFKDENLIKQSGVQHVVIIPHVKEPKDLLRQTLDHLKDQTFNSRQINVVMAAEAADPDGVKVSEELKEEFKDVFNNIWITNHVLAYPDIKGKSANTNWAGREVYKIVKEKGWDMKKTLVTSCDADSKLDPKYYSYVTYKYITTPFREYKYYASAMIFYNNLWRLPFYARVLNSFRTVFNVANLVRPDKLVPFSTYTLSFWMIEQIDFWDPWVTPEDYHLFMKGLFKVDKHVETIPIFLPTMSDSAEGDTHRATIRNNYLQTRRWMWGLSDDGWMIKNLIKTFPTLSLSSKYKVSHVLFDHIMALSLPAIILMGGTVPGWIADDFYNNVSGVLFQIVSGNLIRTTLIFLLVIVYFDYLFRPKPDNFPLWKKVLSIFEWVTQPIVSFFLATVPGFEAQTRLIFGKYLEYYVTEKKAGEDEENPENNSEIKDKS